VSKQARLESLVEIILNTMIGFWISFAAWPLIAPMFGIEYTVSSNFGITAIYTALSIARGYAVRRFFANGLHRAAVKIARRLAWR